MLAGFLAKAGWWPGNYLLPRGVTNTDKGIHGSIMQEHASTQAIETTRNEKWNTGVVLLVLGVMAAVLAPGLVFSMVQAAIITPVQFSYASYPVECNIMIVSIIASVIVSITGIACIVKSRPN
jgi:hypothetical protein